MASMSKEERAKQYLDWLEEDKTPTGIQRVVNNLNGLIYTNTQKPVSKEYKLQIIAEMEKQAPSHGTILEHAENKSILLLIQTVKAKIESDKGNKS